MRDTALGLGEEAGLQPAAPQPVPEPLRGAAGRARSEAASAALAAMAAQPHRWNFYQAMRLLEAVHPEQPRLGQARRPGDEPLRLGQSADLAFAPSSIARVLPNDSHTGRPRMEVRFFGLFGPNGPLPLHMTAYARERSLHKGDDTFARFADWFHHRLLLLFYRAWAQAQPAASMDRPQEDRFADYVGSLVGLGGPAWRQRDAAPDHARLAFAGLLSRQVRNADGLAHLLSGYLDREVRVEQFVGRWMPLPREDRSRLGHRAASRRQSTCQLGASAVLGQAVFDRQHHFRIHVTGLRRAEFEALLPDGRALPAVQALVDQYLGLEFGWDLHLELRREDVGRCRVGPLARLGWNSWLGPPRHGQTAVLNLRPPPAGAAKPRPTPAHAA